MARALEGRQARYRRAVGESRRRRLAHAAGLQAAHNALTTRYQTLNVGVVELPGEPSPYFLPTDADLREHYLTHPWLFEVADVLEKAAFRSSYFEEWEPLDLGRRAVHIATEPQLLGIATGGDREPGRIVAVGADEPQQPVVRRAF